MKKILVLLLMLTITSSLLIGCSESSELKDVIQNNLEAMNKEDIDLYMSAMKSDTAEFEMIKTATIQMFETYDLEAKIKDIEILEENDTTAKVRVVQVTKKIDGPEFKDNEIEMIHNLEKIDGEWKFVTSEIKDIKYLD